jgi:hypothetical protein
MTKTHAQERINYSPISIWNDCSSIASKNWDPVNRLKVHSGLVDLLKNFPSFPQNTDEKDYYELSGREQK